MIFESIAVDEGPAIDLFLAFSGTGKVDLDGFCETEFGLFDGRHFEFSIKDFFPVDIIEKGMLLDLVCISG